MFLSNLSRKYTIIFLEKKFNENIYFERDSRLDEIIEQWLQNMNLKIRRIKIKVNNKLNFTRIGLYAEYSRSVFG
jgi:hypothetical protein